MDPGQTLTEAQSAFQALDWIVLGLYGLVLLGTGIWFSRRKQANVDDYFLGARSIPAWAVAISILATAQSAATFIGGPEQSYAGNLTYISANIGQIIGALIVAFFFIPVFYRHRVSTVYELLERRCGPGAKLAASWMFMIGRVFASGARLFMAGIAGAMILFGDSGSVEVAVAIGALAVIGITYTLVGGIRSVIWTDVIQTVVYVGAAACAAVILFNRIPAGFDEIMQALRTRGPDDSSKLTWIRFDFGGFTPAHTYTFWTAILGFAILNLAAFGTDQDLAQRMLTCSSARKGAWSIIVAIVVSIPVTLLFMAVGLLLFIFYKCPDLMDGRVPEYTNDVRSLKVFLQFILSELPAGLSGLMMAGLIAAGLSSLNSALNAMSSAFVNDFYRPIRPHFGERHYVLIGRVGVVVWGSILAGFAVLCYFWQQRSNIPLIDFALMVMVFAYSGLAAVFVTVIFTRRGNTYTVIAALAVGFFATFFCQPYGRELIDSFLRLESRPFANMQLAFPWQLTFASGLAFLVCVAGTPRKPAVSDS